MRLTPQGGGRQGVHMLQPSTGPIEGAATHTRPGDTRPGADTNIEAGWHTLNKTSIRPATLSRKKGYGDGTVHPASAHSHSTHRRAGRLPLSRSHHTPHPTSKPGNPMYAVPRGSTHTRAPPPAGGAKPSSIVSGTPSSPPRERISLEVRVEGALVAGDGLGVLAIAHVNPLLERGGGAGRGGRGAMGALIRSDQTQQAQGCPK